MAILFANYLTNLGIEVWIYKLQHLTLDGKITLTNDLDELIKGASFCIIGGGAMLPTKRIKASKVDELFAYDFSQLLIKLNTYNCKIYPISIGGSGNENIEKLAPSVRDFWVSPNCSTATIRNRADLLMLKNLGKECSYYPDILWLTDSSWKIIPLPNNTSKLQVGINIKKGIFGEFILIFLKLITRFKKDTIFYFITTHRAEYHSQTNYELIPSGESEFIKIHRYEKPMYTMNFLKSLDIIISSKLHLGLSAMSMGVPFISFDGLKKNDTFLSEINANFAILKKKNIFQLLLLLYSRRFLKSAINKFNFSDYNEFKKKSRGHLDFLKSLVEKYSKYNF